MRENGLPPVLTWRWAPCAALVLGSLSFVGFALMTIPDHIGQVDGRGTTSSLQLGNQFARGQGTPAPANDWAGDTTNTSSASPSLSERTASRMGDVSAFPKRGFSPPLERAEAPAQAVPAPLQMPPQPQLNVPPPVPVAPPPAPPPQVEAPAQAVPVLPAADAPAAQQPAATVQ